MEITPFCLPGAPSKRTLHPNKQRSSSQGSTPAAPKRVGPGRLERGYQTQIGRLQQAIEGLERTHQIMESELEVAHLVERGTARYVDRIETNRRADKAQANRLLVLVGSLQGENARLQGQVTALENRLMRIPTAPVKRTLLQRLGFRSVERAHALPGRSA